MWSVFKLGRGNWAHVEWLVDLPEQEAKDHAAMLNKRFYPAGLYWAQPPKTAAVRTQEPFEGSLVPSERGDVPLAG